MHVRVYVCLINTGKRLDPSVPIFANRSTLVQRWLRDNFFMFFRCIFYLFLFYFIFVFIYYYFFNFNCFSFFFLHFFLVWICIHIHKYINVHASVFPFLSINKIPLSTFYSIYICI